MFKYVPRGVSGSFEWTSSKSPYLDSLLKLQQFFPLLTTNSWLLNCFKVRVGQKNHLRMSLPTTQSCVRAEPRVLPFSLALYSSETPRARIAQVQLRAGFGQENLFAAAASAVGAREHLTFIGLRLSLLKAEQIYSGNASQTRADLCFNLVKWLVLTSLALTVSKGSISLQWLLPFENCVPCQGQQCCCVILIDLFGGLLPFSIGLCLALSEHFRVVRHL